MTDPRELEALLAMAETGELSEEQRARLNALLREDEAAIDATLAQIEIDALLRWHYGTALEAAPPRTANIVAPSFPWKRTLVAAAASLLIILGLWWRGAFDRPQLSDTWDVRPTGGAQFTVVASHEIELESGELFVRSTTNVDAGELTIRTRHAVATAKGTSFYVGAHETADPTPPRKEREMKSLTRVLVLSGTVTLTTALGATDGTSNELLFAQQGGEPSKLVVRAGGDFGFDLYRQLAKEHPGDDLFFSAYSIASALTMAAEGARGQTAEEMAAVLRWPEAARRVGGDAQAIPFEVARIHGAFSELNRLFNTASDQNPEQKQILARLEVLQKELAGMQEKMKKARAAKDWSTIRELRQQVRKPGEEYEALAHKVKSYRLRVANALWGEKTYPFAADYLKTVREAYDSGAVVQADFKNDPKAAIAQINAWVEAQTEGRIRDIASYPSINELTRLVLLNAIYFKAEWQEPFDMRSTRDRDFTTLAGGTVKVKMMQRWNHDGVRYGAFGPDGAFFASPDMIDSGQKDGLYPGKGGFQVLELPYRGEDLAMVVLLPKDADGISDLEARLNSVRLEQWLDKLERRKTHVNLPRWRSETMYPLNTALQALGMKRAFSDAKAPLGADFSGMFQESVDAEELHIQAVMHKAFVEVNEEGTEAAAATMVAVGAKGSRPKRVPFVPVFEANRPFIYLIRDVRSGVVLFTGRKVK